MTDPRSPRPTRYVVESIPLHVVGLAAYEAEDPDPWREYDDARTLAAARKIAAMKVEEGVVGARATIYRRYGYRYRKENDSWDYSMEEA